jgi:RNA polymerase sigma-70 factor (ECF subfamily)
MKSPSKSQAEVGKSVLDKARDGDRKAFVEIVRMYEDIVFGFSFKVCRDREKAEETVQDTFISVFRKLRQFDGKSKFTTWLYSIVANNCLMKRRRSKLQRETMSIDEPQGFHEDPLRDKNGKIIQTIPTWKETPHDIVAGQELRTHLDNAILKLPMDYRIVFILRDVEGKSAGETATILNLTVPAVKSRLHRARAFLREQLNEYMTS